MSAERKAVNYLEKDEETVPTNIITEPRAVENGFEFTTSSTAPELERLLQSPLVRDAQKHAKALQIMDFLWVDSIPQYSSYSFGTDSGIELRVTKRKTLDRVSIEEWGYANNHILLELLKQNQLDTAGFISYIRYTNLSPCLQVRMVFGPFFDKEYREHQAMENFEWSTRRQDIREFQLILKRDNPTIRAFQDANTINDRQNKTYRGGATRYMGNQSDRRKGPFLSDGREICRNFNNDNCNRVDGKMAHNCALCMSSSHSAVGHTHSSANAPTKNYNRLGMGHQFYRHSRYNE
ncbi:hypothetical protein LOTGIDRAFT_157032 [Lottia gigantea]|uniref:Uncharacterized protein n=1 Tax=Lottia gigantea TaxID=225164 RepID=V4B6A4_LOTGI|nr:hypothetical protein LOTGIDRAFT_157032 [Lottia gigantea]ESP03071.1 hypothetical protein LOTGIDRAFT_157032 [Lottia gigantea]